MLAIAVVAVYLVALVSVGVRKSRAVSDQATFSLAGRGLGPGILVGTLLATWTGTGTIFGSAEEAYLVGLPALLLPLAAAVGILGLVVMIPRVRAHGRFTLQDILEERFGPLARVLGTTILVGGYLIIVSYQFRAGAAVLARLGLHAGLGALDEPTALVVVALFVGLYTALAGMMSIAATDTINGLLMTVGLLVALPIVWLGVGGGVDGVLASLPEPSMRRVGGHYGAFDLFSVLVPPFLLVLGDANLHQRFLSASTTPVARRAALLLIPGILLVDAVVILIGVAGRAVAPELATPGHVVLELALSSLPAAVGALLVASILAVIVSTADSFLLASATGLVQDVYKRFRRPDASGRRLLFASRATVVLLTAIALGLAFLSERFFDVALFAYTIYGVGITPVLLAALFWRRATPAGAVASMVTATGVAIAWKTNDLGAPAAARLGLPPDTRVDAVVPSILVALVVLVGVSLGTRPRAPLPAAPGGGR